jgi:hypothetical protein
LTRSTSRVIPYEPAHGRLIDRGDSDVAWLGNPGMQFDAQAAAGTAVTLLINGRIAAIGGVARLWPGLGEVWMVPTKLARTAPLALTRTAREVIAYSLQSLSLRRAQCFCKTTDKRAVRWAEALGFTREATLRRYGADGADYELLAIVR